ncbi:MAG: peptidylprolyl isomerase [Crocinitomicaceae bacterium]|nr:peptidylprolyl isomerase [Crocinitomicaceae bacterium]
MKKLFVLLTGLLLTTLNYAQDNDPVVLKINGENIYGSEFWYIYSKNNPNPSTKPADLDAYMELFINYKLKVREAEALGYDTIPKLKKELFSYRKQLAMPYLIDKDKNEALIKEAYDRIKNEVRASHILVRVNPGSTPEDTLKAYQRAMDLRARIIGGEDFSTVAKGIGGSDDPSAKQNGGDLGYFTALQMVYPFEDAAFKLNVGEVSMPVRTRFGYHIIQVNDKRPSKGRIKVAHIMVISNDKMSSDDQEANQKKINEIYELVEKGEDFGELAKKYSDDKSSAMTGGILPEFGAGSKQRMVPQFEDAAFTLTKDGDFTKPIKTVFGYHIIKRIELNPVPPYEEMYRELKLKVEKDVRAQSTKEAFINKLKKDYNFVDNGGQYLTTFAESMGENFDPTKWRGLEGKLDPNAVMFSFADQQHTVADIENYIKNIAGTGTGIETIVFLKENYNIHVNAVIMDYEDSKLESKYPEFNSLVKEYRDGILVFEIMQDEVWRKASEDTTGIKKYYEDHKSEFTYPVRYNGELYKCKDQSTAKQVYNMVKSDTLSYGKIQEIVNENSALNVVVKTQTFNSETTEAFKKGKKIRKFKTGLNKVFAYNGEYYVFKVKEVQPPREREFTEAKGLVTAAYQNLLEENWIKSLRSKYKIEIMKDALYSIGQ